MTDLQPLRHAHDFYATPPEATRALLSVQTFDGPIWEPCCGDGAIANVLLAAGHAVVATDLVDRGYGEGGINFLAQWTHRAKHVVTNPPYRTGLADQFIRHALTLCRSTGGTVAMLLDLASLAHPSRTPFYLANPPSAVYILDHLTFLPPRRSGDIVKTRYCWMVWIPGRAGPPMLGWLSPSKFKRRGGR